MKTKRCPQCGSNNVKNIVTSGGLQIDGNILCISCRTVGQPPLSILEKIFALFFYSLLIIFIFFIISLIVSPFFIAISGGNSRAISLPFPSPGDTVTITLNRAPLGDYSVNPISLQDANGKEVIWSDKAIRYVGKGEVDESTGMKMTFKKVDPISRQELQPGARYTRDIRHHEEEVPPQVVLELSRNSSIETLLKINNSVDASIKCQYKSPSESYIFTFKIFEKSSLSKHIYYSIFSRFDLSRTVQGSGLYSIIYYGLIALASFLILPGCIIAAIQFRPKAKSFRTLSPEMEYIDNKNGSVTLKYIYNQDGTVTDPATSLMWAATDNGAHIEWNDAWSYCMNYRGGGYADWRMPTIQELRALDQSKATLLDKNIRVWSSNVDDFRQPVSVSLGDMTECVGYRALPVRASKWGDYGG